jgi:hydrogenase expression/formation protein HypC
MCLAIPAKVVSIGDNHMAEVDILGVSRTVSLDLTPDAVVGDHVLVHAGYAIQVVDEQFAKETLDLMLEMDLMAEESEGIDLQAAVEPLEAPTGTEA